MSILMGRKGFPGNSTVTLTQYSYTKNIAQITTQADIIITALGVPNHLKRNGKDGAVVIDVGITRVADETTEKRDISLQVMLILKMSKKKFYSCAGVGPMTIAMLMKTPY
jgi:methylenetetrahydrofolate dehydrogenase (NADP+)/methenyltetrahydrofolate cyclohydrolase